MCCGLSHIYKYLYYMNTGIYKITNIITNKIYVGYTL